MTDSPVGIGDVVRALAALRPRSAAIELVVQACGMHLVPVSTPPLASYEEQLAEPASAEDDDRPAATAATEILSTSVRRLEAVRQGQTPGAPQVDPLEGARPTAPPVGFEGLFAARDAVEVLRLAASVPMPTERIDIIRVVSELARARPLTTLPTLSVPSLAFGAQVLVDVGTSMQPFLEDQQDLVNRLTRGLRQAADIRYCADDPSRRAGPDRRKASWQPYTLPRPGTPAIALTDLGCGFPRRSHATEAWMALAERLRRRRSRLVVFAPVRMTRVPPALGRTAVIVRWDRRAGRRAIAQLSELPG